jgi:two-component system LytT family sensor kinase
MPTQQNTIGSKASVNWAKIFLHSAIWALIFLYPFLFNADRDDVATSIQAGEERFVYLDALTKVFWVGLFYFHADWLIPKLFYPKKYILYAGALILTFLLIMGIHGILFEWIMIGRNFQFFRSSLHNILAFSFTIALSATYKIMGDRTREEEIKQEKRQEVLRTELSFLRSQISPHFLFNVLNNIVAMVRLKSDELEPTVIRLSSLLQYMLYENDEEKMLLGSEIEQLQNYIDLQMLRYGSRVKITTRFQMEENRAIEPMLLIPFVENAFKHGTGNVPDPEIRVQMEEKDGFLHFTVQNKYVQGDVSKDKTSGIGLANVRRRLELLYPGRHQLNIQEHDGHFDVDLKIKLGNI